MLPLGCARSGVPLNIDALRDLMNYGKVLLVVLEWILLAGYL
ncbi:MAG: hypothetical protein QW624_02085 [Nitrososphaerota archaeon]